MSVGFGFSLGDFIQAVKLVSTVIDALSENSGSSAELKDLLRQQYSLETALREVSLLEVDERLYAEVLALKQTAAQCQLTVSGFLKSIGIYHPYLLGGDAAEGSLHSKWKRVQWALCKKKDVVRFRADLLGHTESIQLLLTTLHMKNSALDRKNQLSIGKTIVSQIQYGFSSCMSRLSDISSTVCTISAHAQDCIESCRRIISMNVRIFQAVLDIQQMLTTIPGQIERQQPVYLTDSLGRDAPFHLEFIKSAETLLSVLSVNNRETGYASVKVNNNQCNFYTADRVFDLRCPWENLFIPG